MRAARALVLLLGLLAAGCDDDKKNEGPKAPDPPRQGGELGKGTFEYKCLGPADAQCDFDKELGSGIGGSDYQLPAIATGSKFGLSFQLYSPEGEAPQLVALHPTFATAVNGEVTALKAGKTSLGLTRAGNTQVVDMVDVEIVDMQSIKVFAGKPSGEFDDFSVTPTGVKYTGTFTFRFRVVPAGPEQKLLAGQFPCLWTTSDPNIARITSAVDDNIVEIVTGAAGTATITVKLGEQTLTIPIEVG